MDDGKGIIVVKLDKCPITYRRKIYARISRVNETTCQFSENFAVFISYEVAIPVDRSHASHVAVGSLRLRSFVLKPQIKSESSRFHIKLSGHIRLDCWLTESVVCRSQRQDHTPRSGRRGATGYAPFPFLGLRLIARSFNTSSTTLSLFIVRSTHFPS